jgi:hypothetical protein
MKKYLLIFIISLIILFSGYAILSHLTGRIYFKGESKHWKAYIDSVYKKSKNKAENHNYEILMVNYKGKNPKEVGVFDYYCKAPYGTVWSGNNVLNPNGSFQIQSEESGRTYKKGDKFILIITWSGLKETIVIK